MPVPYLFGWSWVWPGRALWTCQTLARRALRKVTRFTSADPHVEMASPTGGGPLCVCVGKKTAFRFFPVLCGIFGSCTCVAHPVFITYGNIP